jgi:hypothetical protein
MSARAFVAIWALLGGLVGAILAAPVGQTTVTNPPGCAACPEGGPTLLVGLHVSGTYPAWMWVGAALLGAVLFAAVGTLYTFYFRD